MKIIVGLGNPGKQYENTYHNAGFMAVDALCEKLGAGFQKNAKLQAMTAETRVSGEKVLIVKPETFMNLSGESVSAVVNFYKEKLSNLLVIYDDLDLPVGAIRFRKSGSAGTHNGMRNIVLKLGSGEFARARIGTANDNPNIPIIDYVLSKISNERKTLVDVAIKNVVELASDFISGLDGDKLMCKYNGKK